MLQRWWSGGSGGAREEAPGPSQQLTDLQKQVEKVRGYYNLGRVSTMLPPAAGARPPPPPSCPLLSYRPSDFSASSFPLPDHLHTRPQEAVERAYAKDVAGQRADAAHLYRTALDILLEGLAQPAPSSGLGAAGSNTGRWRADMNAWQQQVLERLRALEGLPPSGRGAGGSAAEGVAAGSGGSAVPANPLLRRPAAGAGGGRPLVPGAALGAPHAQRPSATASTAAQRDEREFGERVLSEVLDSTPSVAWDDVAGLAGAKQARD